MGKEAQLDKIEFRAETIAAQIEARMGAIKVDSNEAALHPRIVARLGEYAQVYPLKSGDYAFNTAFSKIARIELKSWDDLIHSITTRRITEQLRRHYEEDCVSVLLIEGHITATHGGMILTSTKEYKRPMTWLWNYLLSAQMAGTYLYISPNDSITASVILGIFEYMNKESHDVMMGSEKLSPAIPKATREKLVTSTAKLTPKQLMLTAIPTVGAEAAILLDRHFNHSIQKICNATVEELKTIEGIGNHKANVIYKFVRDII